MLKTCEICHAEFETNNPLKKYCSELCSKEARRHADKLRKRNVRKVKRDMQSAEYEELRAQRMQAHELKLQEIQKQRQAEIKEKLKLGDPLTRKMQAKPFSKEYWDAYRDYIIQCDAESGRETVATVNDISVLDDDFTEKVMISVKELNSVRTNNSRKS